MQTRQFPAEWHTQWGVLLAWPHPNTDWADNLNAAERCYSEIISAITQYEQVLLLCHDAQHQAHIQVCLAQTDCQLARIVWVQQPYNDTWARDFGFITILAAQKPLLLDFTFNAWGGKFDADLDNALNQELVKQPLLASNRLEVHELVLEGGSLESDGQGTLLTTEICLLNPNRNPSLSKADIEQALKSSLGVKRVLWLAQGHLEGDDTDAHIDTLARFADPQTIVYMSCDDPTDSHFNALHAMEQELTQLCQANGQAYNLIPIPLPQAIYQNERRLPASYVNFLIMNHAVLLPIYHDARTDIIAIQQMQHAFPQHKIIPIDCRALIAQNGSLHCITMQIPQEVISTY
jgi:agmatine/peptidylarginine deiminase